MKPSTIRSLVITSSIATVVALALPTDARAEDIAATSCVPDDDTIQNDLYQVSGAGGYYEFKTGVTGTAAFVCPVAPDPTSANLDAIGLYYSNDGDGATANYYVKADLHRINKSTGTVDEACSVTSSSNSFGSVQDTTCGGNLDFGSYIYFFRVFIVRTGTTYSPRFYAVTTYNEP